MTPDRILAVDVGQTGLRLRVDDGEVVESPLGVRALTEASRVRSLVDRIVEHVPSTPGLSAVGVGLSGFVEGSAAPAALAAGLGRALRPSTVVVAADAVTAFLGAVGNRPGAAVICGTGVAALGVESSGRARRIDARGYLLGDLGGGFWVGQRGLHAALDAIEHRGAPTTLAAASRRLGAPEAIYHDAMRSTPPPQYIAGFAPDVLSAAASGDEVAGQIVEEAADHIARSLRSARPHGGPIGLTGGLTRAGTYVRAVHQALVRLGIDATEVIVRPDAALEGARVLTGDPSSRSAFAGLIAVEEYE